MPPAASSAESGAPSMVVAPSTTYSQLTPSRPQDSVNDGRLPVVIQGAMRQDIELSPADERETIIAKVAALKTRSDAAAYLAGVSAKRGAVVDHPTN